MGFGHKQHVDIIESYYGRTAFFAYSFKRHSQTL